MSNKDGMPEEEALGFMACLLCGVKLQHDTGKCNCEEDDGDRDNI
jgi:hypothetical protein